MTQQSRSSRYPASLGGITVEATHRTLALALRLDPLDQERLADGIEAMMAYGRTVTLADVNEMERVIRGADVDDQGTDASWARDFYSIGCTRLA